MLFPHLHTGILRRVKMVAQQSCDRLHFIPNFKSVSAIRSFLIVLVAQNCIYFKGA